MFLSSVFSVFLLRFSGVFEENSKGLHDFPSRTSWFRMLFRGFGYVKPQNHRTWLEEFSFCGFLEVSWKPKPKQPEHVEPVSLFKKRKTTQRKVSST